MGSFALIIAISTTMWYIIDRFKPLWESLKFGKYITIAISAAFAFCATFGFGLDMVHALELVATESILGKVFTAFVLMSGSSAINEIVEQIKAGANE